MLDGVPRVEEGLGCQTDSLAWTRQMGMKGTQMVPLVTEVHSGEGKQRVACSGCWTPKVPLRYLELCTHYYYLRAVADVKNGLSYGGFHSSENGWSSLSIQVWHRTEVVRNHCVWLTIGDLVEVRGHGVLHHELNCRCCSSQRMYHDSWGRIGA